MLFFQRLLILLPLAGILAFMPFNSSFCQNSCENEGMPCDEDENTSTLPCCATDQASGKALKCSTDPGTEGTCIFAE